jgi:hypothetical protein
MLASLMPNQPVVTERILQEYLQTLAEEHGKPGPQRAKRLLTSYAEFRFRVAGGSQCPLCRASVRHVLPVLVLRSNGEKVNYPCLCTRCLEAERDGADSIEIGLDDIKWVVEGRK